MSFHFIAPALEHGANGADALARSLANQTVLPHQCFALDALAEGTRSNYVICMSTHPVGGYSNDNTSSYAVQYQGSMHA